MRIVAGSHKGREIPFNNKKYGNADITPQIVKEALFDIIGADINGSVFLDLFACSGQIGIEAFSRGVRDVYLNEQDGRRYRFFKEYCSAIIGSGHIHTFNLNAKKCLAVCAHEGVAFNYVYLDPPYYKQKGGTELYTELLNCVQSFDVLAPDALLIVQHFTGNILEDTVGLCNTESSRVYGSSTLHFYRYVSRALSVD